MTEPMENKQEKLAVKIIKPVELLVEMMEPNMTEPMENKQEMLAVKIIKPVEMLLDMMEPNMTEPMENKQEMLVVKIIKPVEQLLKMEPDIANSIVKLLVMMEPKFMVFMIQQEEMLKPNFDTWKEMLLVMMESGIEVSHQMEVIAKHLIDFAMHFDKLMVNSITKHLNSIIMLEMSFELLILHLIKYLGVSLLEVENNQSN
jgi:hypothetical protein